MQTFSYALFMIFAANVFHTCAAADLSIGGSASGLRVDVTHHASNPNPQYAGSDWNFRINRSQAILHWSTTPFRHLDASKVQTDATLTVQLKNKLGPISIAPSKSSDQTQLHDNDTDAAVMMTAVGSGRAQIELHVGIDDPNTAAGRYGTTVVLSVTAP